MQKECPCGCGRRISYWSRRIAKNGVLLDQGLDALDRVVEPTMQEDEEAVVMFRDFRIRGEVYRSEVYDIVHGEDNGADFDRAGMNAWIRDAAEWVGATAELWRRLEAAEQAP